MTRLVLTVAALLAFPAAAAAAPLGELPFEQRKGVAGCLQATGAPGGLAVLGPYSRRASATDLLTAGGERTARVNLGRLFTCAAVAEAPGGAAIMAGSAVTRGGDSADTRVVVRDPGGAFGAAMRLDRSFARPAVAIAPSGAAAVAWVAGGGRPAAERRLVVARRASGGEFAPPETVLSWTGPEFLESEVQAATDAAGTVTVLLTRELATERGGDRIEVATAAPGATFARQRLAARAVGDPDPVLAVAPDGWALVVHGRQEVEPPRAFERAPGAARFSAVALPDLMPPRRTFGDATVAVRSGGGAIVAWRRGWFESRSGVDALVRESAGPFTARRIAVPVPLSDFDHDELGLDLLDPFLGPPIGLEVNRLKVALAPDGRVVLAWPAPSGERPLVASTVRAALGRLDGTFEPAQAVGSPMRSANDLAALFTADGRAAVAWTDNTTRPARGRLHVAIEGAAAQPRPAPRLRVTAEPGQRLHPNEPVRARVTCSEACDLRTKVAGSEATSFTRGPGAHVLRIGAVPDLQPGTRRRVRVVVRATAPGGHEARERSFLLPVVGLPPLPLRRPLDVAARRDGDAIVVTWRTAKPARRQLFIVIGAVRGAPDGGFDPSAYALRPGHGRTRFRVRLRPDAPDRVERITVLVESYDSAVDGPSRTVRVR